MLVAHNNQKGYCPQAASHLPSVNGAQYDRKLFTFGKWLTVDIYNAPFQRNGVSCSIAAQHVDNLKNMLFIDVDEFHYSQKPPFYPHFYTRFIHTCLYFDFNGLAVL